jgi:isocitrate/isopropylmalate dehydrogenase
VSTLAARSNGRGLLASEGASRADRRVSAPPPALQVTLIPGDGVGPELTDSVKEIFEHVNVPVKFDQYNVSGETGGDDTLFQSAMESLKRNKVGLKGASESLRRAQSSR